MKNRKAIPLIVYLLLLFAVFSWANNLFSDNLSQIPYSQVVELFRQEQVKAFEIQDDVITMELHGTLNGENIIKASLAYPEHFLTEMGGLLQEQKASGVLEQTPPYPCRRGVYRRNRLRVREHQVCSTRRANRVVSRQCSTPTKLGYCTHFAIFASPNNIRPL